MKDVRLPVILENVPVGAFDAAVTYLADVLRECQLVLIDGQQGTDLDPELESLAMGLVPDLEKLRGIFRGATIGVGAGRYRVSTELHGTDAAMMSRLQVQLGQLERRGGMLVAGDPQVAELLRWVWEEAAGQLEGRDARPCRRP